MLTFSILILCINIDALSYGVANGAKGRSFSLLYILLVCAMSTVMFAVPLAVSKYVFQYFNELACRIINATFLILMGIIYLIPKEKIKKLKKSKKNKNKLKKINIQENDTNYSQNTAEIKDDTLMFDEILSRKTKKKNTPISFSRCFCECFVISVDAIFSAFLSGFSENFYLYSVIFYAVTNYLAILIGNRLLFRLGRRFNFSFDLLGGLVFILLGILKIVGF